MRSLPKARHCCLSRTSPLPRHNAAALALTLAATLLLTTACGSRRAAANVPAARIGSSQEGIASWYGEPYHGRRAANGEIYDMDKPTAAHPSLPFETWVRVHSLASRKNTDVRITDRGPFVKGRIIDLSRAAARDIDLIRDGTARVRITVIDPPPSYLRGRQFTIQVSSLPTKPRAELLRKQLAPRFPDVAVRYRPPNPKGGHSEAWRVLVGREPSPAAAARLLLNLQDRFPNAFIVPWDTD